MTIRGSRNQSIKTTAKDAVNLSWGRELGPGDDDIDGTVEYIQANNDAVGTSAGMIFSKGDDHIMLGTAQADRLPA